MEYIGSNVCYVMGAKGARVGARGYFADSPYRLKERVADGGQEYFGTLTCIKPGDNPYRFVKDGTSDWMLFYPVDAGEDIPLTMGTVSKLCGKDYASNTYALLACCADKIAEATKLYKKWDLDLAHFAENKSEFTRALVDLVCCCGKIAYLEYIDIDKALTAKLFNDGQEVKVEKN